MTDNPPLDDVMLAMDVVDTLRHNEKLVARELEGEAREQGLRKRLKEIYAAQGIDVPDHVLDEGVKALDEQRFVYTPPEPGFTRTLAYLYINRKVWSVAVSAIVVVVALIWGGYHFFVSAPREQAIIAERIERTETLPKALASLQKNATEITTDETAREAIQRIFARGDGALKAGDLATARAAREQLERLQANLLQSYTVRIVSGPNKQSGVWRVPDANSRARNYYLIVEAIGDNGAVVPVTLTSEETGAAKTVEAWGVRVKKRAFDAVRQDAQDDGIIQNREIGSKQTGKLTIDYTIPVMGGVIFEW